MNKEMCEIITLWNSDYQYVLRFESGMYTIGEFVQPNNYLIFQLMSQAFEENIIA